MVSSIEGNTAVAEWLWDISDTGRSSWFLLTLSGVMFEGTLAAEASETGLKPTSSTEQTLSGQTT